MKTINYLNTISKILQTRRTNLLNKKTETTSTISSTITYSSELNSPSSKSNKTRDFLNNNEFVYFWEAPKWLLD